MSITKIVRATGNVALAQATWGGTQNFLGARWIENLVDCSPRYVRARLALRLLSLSPHYFYDRDIVAEAERNRQSRKMIVDTLIVPYLTSEARVLDYGCGPGYMATAVAGHVAHVDAVDISRGVLACARAINGQSNITYLTPGEFSQGNDIIDLAYSFAVAQHLTRDVLIEALGMLASRIRQNGILILHFAEPGLDGWRTEAECMAGGSVSNRVKLRYGLNCFGRSVEQMEELVIANCFTDVATRPLHECFDAPLEDDIVKQHVLIARRK